MGAKTSAGVPSGRKVDRCAPTWTSAACRPRDSTAVPGDRMTVVPGDVSPKALG